jgi:hypothetical protein
MFQALQSRFVGLMEALRDKLPAEPAAEAQGALESVPTTEEPAEAEAPTAEAEAPTAEPEAPTAEASTNDQTTSEGEE